MGPDSVRLALYNLSTDPGEDRDVKDQFPEIVQQLNAIADKYRNELGDGLKHNVGTGVRPAGKLAN
jgi:arylsulfatase